MLQILILETVMAGLAAALAFQNRVPCKKMIDYGASLKEEREWHGSNGIVKIISAAGFALYQYHQPGKMVLLFVALLLVCWVIFDCVLGYLLHKDITYIGETATIDKALRFGITIHLKNRKILIKGLGHYAGLIKILVASTAILVINFFL